MNYQKEFAIKLKLVQTKQERQKNSKDQGFPQVLRKLEGLDHLGALQNLMWGVSQYMEEHGEGFKMVNLGKILEKYL